MAIDDGDDPGEHSSEDSPDSEREDADDGGQMAARLVTAATHAKTIASDMGHSEDSDWEGVVPAGEELNEKMDEGVTHAQAVHAGARVSKDPIPVRKDDYSWVDFMAEYYYDEEGNPPRDAKDEVIPFDPVEYLGFDPASIEAKLSIGGGRAAELESIVDDRTVDIQPDLDEDAFFSTVDGHTTVVNRYDLEKAVSLEKKLYFREVERYWVNKPFAFVIIFHSRKENEKKYYLVEPYTTRIEDDLQEFLTEKLRTAIKYAEEGVVIEGSDAERRDVIEREARRLLDRYNLYSGSESGGRGFLDGLFDSMFLDNGDGVSGRLGSFLANRGLYEPPTVDESGPIEGISARPEPVILEEDQPTLSEYQVEKLLYSLIRDFIGYERIDGIKHDINVEDISCDGYNSPVFVYHTDYEQLITNVRHGESSLDDFVVKLAQRAGKGISKRQPQVDATLPDGSRSQLTLGTEVSDHGTNYTIRQFKDVPFTPVDLINWKTFSLDEMAFLWLCIENNKSLLFAGGTASGKTTSLNAVSLFVPSNAKIVSIEDTREVELPQRNWIASITRPSFGEDEAGDIDEFDLLEAALRQRPDYIIMGEVRGEEGRTLFQVMSTGHTTYTTFHADNVSEVIKRFTTEPINVSKTLFTALDLISIQAQTRIRGKKVRRSRSITEIRRYDAENDEINVNDVYQWRPESDSYRSTAESTTLDEIQFDRGWSDQEIERELFERRVILAYLIENGLNTYTEVAATIQAYINDPETILTLVANDQLENALDDLRTMESVLIDVEEEKEEMVPRPDPSDDVLETTDEILGEADRELFPEYIGEDAPDIGEILSGVSIDDVQTGVPTAAPDQASETTQEPASTSASEPASASTSGSDSASMPESVSEASSAPPEDLHSASDLESISEAPQDSASESPPEFSAESASDSTSDSAPEFGGESGPDSGAESAPDFAAEPGSETEPGTGGDGSTADADEGEDSAPGELMEDTGFIAADVGEDETTDDETEEREE